MSLKYPRRIKDLPQLDLDSEDEFNTPIKPKKQAEITKEIESAANKENESISNVNIRPRTSRNASISSHNIGR